MNDNRYNLSVKCAILVLVSFLFKLSAVGVPSDPEVSDYMHIDQKNPFKLLIEKKIVLPHVPQVKKRDQYVLKGVTELSSGWLVVIAEIANPKTSIMLRSDQPVSGKPRVINVVTNKLDYRKTEVELSVAGEKQIVRYHSSSKVKVAQAVNREKLVRSRPVTHFRDIVEKGKTSGAGTLPDVGNKENNSSGSENNSSGSNTEPQRTRPKFNQQ